MNSPILYLMLGYPGSGKTTTAKELHEITGAVHIWADHERQKMVENPQHTYEESLELYKQLNARTNQLLAAGLSVIFDTNFNYYKDREKLRRIASRHNAKSVLIWVRTPKELAQARATEQVRFPYSDSMPHERFNRKVKNLQKPRSNEQYIEVDGTKITTEYIKKVLKDYL